MSEEPIKAAELVRKARTGLSRYRTMPDTLSELSGLLADVQTMGESDAWIVVRPVDGLRTHEMATATGTNTDGIARLRMTEVRTINGTPVAAGQR